MLVACLETGRGQTPRFVIPALALDVLDQEPPRICQRDPHLHSAGVTKEAAIRMALSTARNVLAGKLDD